jgi:hypothetical protein
MLTRRTRSYRDYLVIALVLCGHAVLLVLFARARQREQVANDQSNRTTAFLIEVPASATPEMTPIEPAISRTTIVEVPPPSAESAPSAPSTPVTTPATAPDWRREAERAAGNAIREQSAPQPRKFGAREAPAEAPKARPFGWDPSPGRFGFSGGLPYMELGKKCVIGLGFFACGIGELPPANGELFEHMDDPDREHSSVPDPNQ